MTKWSKHKNWLFYFGGFSNIFRLLHPHFLYGDPNGERGIFGVQYDSVHNRFNNQDLIFPSDVTYQHSSSTVQTFVGEAPHHVQVILVASQECSISEPKAEGEYNVYESWCVFKFCTDMNDHYIQVLSQRIELSDNPFYGGFGNKIIVAPNNDFVAMTS